MEGKQSSLKDFDVINKLGQGAFGQVFKVKRKIDGKEYALKKVKIGSMKAKQRENALNQIRILASYKEEYIIGYKEAFYDESSSTLCVVMEIAEGGDILKKNQTHQKMGTKYPQEEIWKAAVHMSMGLKSLHDKKILHRDLKSANVFITADGIYKLGDLNVSKVLKKDLARTQTGTPYYASPEVWKDKPYGAKSDIWSLGCVLYEMAALKPPFNALDLQGLYKKVCQGNFQRIPMSYSSDLANFIANLLKVDPQRRPATQQIITNSLVQRHYKEQIDVEQRTNDRNDPLLKTIKYNPRDLKGLKNILPKANYLEEKIQKIQIEDMRNGINSCRNSRKSIPQVKQKIQQNKLQEFLERRRRMEDQERKKKLKVIQQSRQSIEEKRKRVLSACGVRPNYICDSPRLVPKKSDQSNGNIGNSKQQNYNSNPHNKQLPPKLPPKPGYNLNYRLPPKPEHQQNINSSANNIPPSSARQKSKQNLRNIGKAIVGGRPPSAHLPRSSSAQKIIYPSWWG